MAKHKGQKAKNKSKKAKKAQIPLGPGGTLSKKQKMQSNKYAVASFLQQKKAQGADYKKMRAHGKAKNWKKFAEEVKKTWNGTPETLFCLQNSFNARDVFWARARAPRLAAAAPVAGRRRGAGSAGRRRGTTPPPGYGAGGRRGGTTRRALAPKFATRISNTSTSYAARKKSPLASPSLAAASSASANASSPSLSSSDEDDDDAPAAAAAAASASFRASARRFAVRASSAPRTVNNPTYFRSLG